MSSLAPDDYLSHALLLEVLEAALTPRRAREVLDEAVLRAGVERVPHGPNGLAGFVEGALFVTLTQRLGVELALEVVEQARPVLAPVMGDSGLGVTDSHVQDAEPGAHRGRIGRVLVVSPGLELASALEGNLDPDIEVWAVHGETELVELIWRPPYRPVLIVVDRHRSRHGVELLAAMEIARAGSALLWWTPREDERSTVRREAPVTVEVLDVPLALSLNELIEAVSARVGR